MKIPRSIRNIYDDQYETNLKLKELADKKIGSLKEDRWHYESRLKSAESFALKVETGRISDPSKLEDFFACTLVVENKGAIRKAEGLIKNLFKFSERRPPSEKKTLKASHAFPFDDLRLYVKWRDDTTLPPTGLSGTLFEVQVKTFLQHAWIIATHDLIYKSDNISWAKERIAYQIKAMLEHAEISIHEAEKLATSPELDKLDKYTDRRLKIIKLVKESWSQVDLPGNVVLLADTIITLMKSVEIDVATLRKILVDETKKGRGTKTLNLSPYGIVIQSLINRKPEKLLEYLSSDSGNFRILIPQEIELPDNVGRGSLRNAIFVE
jgi:ppGpp synthetase/RelA/SpoT-type nucleotidyltranferase